MAFSDGSPSRSVGDGGGHGNGLAVPKRDDLTIEMVRRILPKSVRGNVTEEHIELINQLAAGDMTETFKNNILGFGKVMEEGKYKISQYINATRFVSYKMLGSNNIEAYTKVFPERYQNMLMGNYTERQIAGVCSVYNKGSLVTKIFEQTLVPTHIVNADLHQKAINQLAFLMMNARSEKVQSDSASKLVDALKMPETTKIELDVGLKEDKSIQELRQTTMDLVAQQRLMIKAGAKTVEEIAHSKLLIDAIDGEVVE